METPVLDNIQLSQILKSILEPIVKQAYQDAQRTSTQPGPEIPISIHEAAQLVNKSVSTLYIRHSQGRIPPEVCVKHGRRLYFYRSALLNWIKAGNDGSR